MTLCDRFVRLELGEAFSESPPFNLEAAYQVPPTALARLMCLGVVCYLGPTVIQVPGS